MALTAYGLNHAPCLALIPKIVVILRSLGAAIHAQAITGPGKPASMDHALNQPPGRETRIPSVAPTVILTACLAIRFGPSLPVVLALGAPFKFVPEFRARLAASATDTELQTYFPSDLWSMFPKEQSLIASD